MIAIAGHSAWNDHCGLLVIYLPSLRISFSCCKSRLMIALTATLWFVLLNHTFALSVEADNSNWLNFEGSTFVASRPFNLRQHGLSKSRNQPRELDNLMFDNSLLGCLYQQEYATVQESRQQFSSA